MRSQRRRDRGERGGGPRGSGQLALATSCSDRARGLCLEAYSLSHPISVWEGADFEASPPDEARYGILVSWPSAPRANTSSRTRHVSARSAEHHRSRKVRKVASVLAARSTSSG